MSTTTHVFPVSGVPPRLAELAKGLGKRLRCLVSSPPIPDGLVSKSVSRYVPQAAAFWLLAPRPPAQPCRVNDPFASGAPPRPDRTGSGGREGRRFYRPPQPILIPHRDLQQRS